MISNPLFSNDSYISSGGKKIPLPIGVTWDGTFWRGQLYHPSRHKKPPFVKRGVTTLDGLKEIVTLYLKEIKEGSSINLTLRRIYAPPTAYHREVEFSYVITGEVMYYYANIKDGKIRRVRKSCGDILAADYDKRVEVVIAEATISRDKLADQYRVQLITWLEELLQYLDTL